jgi:KDO2-lipid IV(A) lauroyltransferase
VIAYLLVRLAFATIAIFPALAGVYIKLLDAAIPRFRKIAQRNLEIAGLKDERIVPGTFASLARVLEALAKFPSITRENVAYWIRYEGLENFKAAQSRGRSVLVATAHFGNWELSAFTHALMTSPMHVVVRPLDNPRIDAFIERRRSLSGNHIIEKKNAAREILRALQAGDAVGILIDQNTAPEEGVFVDFFGTKACANAGFAKLAHHSGAAVVPGYALWSEQENRYVLHFDPEIEMTGDVSADTQRIHSHLEQVIRRNPDQYLWIHRRWKTRPPGEPPLY